MAENRSELRRKCMTILYQMTIYDKNHTPYNVDDVINEVSPIDNEFVKEIVYGVLTYKNEIDKLANKYLEDWTIDRLGNTDIAILRMGIFELLYTNTPDVVAINEAVELAKKFSGDEGPAFVNGVLGKVASQEQKA